MSRLRSQDGFTLPELLVAMVIGLMTTLAVLGILDISVKQSTAVAGRVNATQRARLAMDTITRQLRSQVCYNATTPAIVAGTDDSVKFHVDLSNGGKAIEQRELIFNPTTKVITEKQWAGVGAPLAFPTETLSRTVLSDVTRRVAPDPTEIFRFYAYDLNVPPRPDLRLTTPLSATDRARVAKIEIGFMTLPPGSKSAPASSSTLQNEIYVRVADPNDPAPTPTCA